MKPASYIEISKSALKQNHEFIKSIMLPDVKFSSVIKGNAYGHGIEVMVPLLEEIGVDHFSVFSGDEALRVKEICSDFSTVMVMGMLTPEQLIWAIEDGVEFYVFDLFRLEKALEIAKRLQTKAKIHLELETGMNRTGLSIDELEKAIKLLQANQKHITLKGICTHLAGAESIANYYRIKSQLIRYKKLINQLKSEGVESSYKHVSCSAGTIRYPKTQLDMVRIGIMQYGFFPTKEVMVNYFAENQIVDDPLRRVLSWKSQVMNVKEVKTGEFIGYGTAYFASRDMKIATIPIGYGYGFPRSFTNLGNVLIRGTYAPVVGIVNMNSFSVDITDISSVEIGDAVTIIGSDGGLEISVSSFSDISNQVNYELLVRLPDDIPRIVVD
ncbi:MAG: alanine racemase [Weeksellaceae bacterium]